MTLIRLKQRWAARKKYSSYTELSTLALILNGATGFIVSGYYALEIGRVIGPLLDLSNKTVLQHWTIAMWATWSFIAMLAPVIWYFGSLALRCNSILRDRLFK